MADLNSSICFGEPNFYPGGQVIEDELACDFTGTRELIYNRYKFSMLCVERGDLIKDVCREHSLCAGVEGALDFELIDETNETSFPSVAMARRQPQHERVHL